MDHLTLFTVLIVVQHIILSRQKRNTFTCPVYMLFMCFAHGKTGILGKRGFSWQIDRIWDQISGFGPRPDIGYLAQFPGGYSRHTSTLYVGLLDIFCTILLRSWWFFYIQYPAGYKNQYKAGYFNNKMAVYRYQFPAGYKNRYPAKNRHSIWPDIW